MALFDALSGAEYSVQGPVFAAMNHDTDPLLIAKLTPEQEAALKTFARDWTSFSRITPADRLLTQSAIDSLYKDIDLSLPALLWCQSPWQMALFPAFLYLICADSSSRLFKRLQNELSEPLWVTAWRDLERQIGSRKKLLQADTGSFRHTRRESQYPSLVQIKGERPKPKSRQSILEPIFGDNLSTVLNLHLNLMMGRADSLLTNKLGIQAQIKLRDSLYTGLRGQNREQLIRQNFGLRLSGIVGTNLGSSLKSQLTQDSFEIIERDCAETLPKEEPRFAGAAAPQPVDQLFAGQLNLTFSYDFPEWLPTFGFLIENFELDLEPKLDDCIRSCLTLKRNVLQFDCYSRLCLVCEYPCTSHLDERRRLHCENGPAMEFPDGFKIYAIDGVVVPPEVVIAPHSISIEHIDSEANIEVRRIMIRRLGLERYLKDSNAVEIDSDTYGVLYKKEQQNDEPIVVVRVKDATPDEKGEFREYFLRVPPSIRTARQAIAWTFNLTRDEYVPTQQS